MRNRNSLSRPIFGKNDSSEATHDAENFGYNAVPKSAPNALLRSERMAPVRKSRSRKAKLCSTKAPKVRLSLLVSSDSFTDPEVTVVAPGGSWKPAAPLRLKTLR